MTRAVRTILILLAAGVLAIAVLLVVGLREIVADPIVRTTYVALPGWPARTPPLTVALVSDIHIGNRAMDAARLDRIVGAINAHRPDLVLLAGDFVIGHDAASGAGAAEQLVAPLSRLRAPRGRYAVLGNHDHWTGAARVVRALQAAGITILSNRNIRVGPLTLVGIDDAYSGHNDVARAFAGSAPGPRIALTHAPDVVAWLSPGDAPLLLAGHTHCGQVALPDGRGVTELGLLSARPLYNPRYRCGRIDDPGRTVIVTAGVGGGSAPIRLNAPPDWWLITVGGPLNRPRP
ncbi:phosphohydrolase [Sphingomonas sp. MA1305]|uniref:metallophosphoesterase n=1 Tax=Sphingomonas sp. MA1305 TaxID=2479204 RepID=UPI0018DFF270|nr:metallophosphoesterase [Sphingomonas sp. MA1305]MBI0476035.1 phosphohydrolase [Sphingomonas sp. MA1305]